MQQENERWTKKHDVVVAMSGQFTGASQRIGVAAVLFALVIGLLMGLIFRKEEAERCAGVDPLANADDGASLARSAAANVWPIATVGNMR